MRTVSRTEFTTYLRANPDLRPSTYETAETAGMQWIRPTGEVMAHARYVRGLAPQYEIRKD